MLPFAVAVRVQSRGRCLGFKKNERTVHGEVKACNDA